MLEVNQQHINDAFQKLMTFSRVNRQRDHEDKLDSLMLYCQSVGMDEDTVCHLQTLCEKFFHDQEDSSSCAFIGMLIGLAAAEPSLDKVE